MWLLNSKIDIFSFNRKYRGVWMKTKIWKLNSTLATVLTIVLDFLLSLYKYRNIYSNYQLTKSDHSLRYVNKHNNNFMTTNVSSKN